MARLRSLGSELAKWRDQIRARALDVGLDFFEVNFELVEPNEINEIAALGGFPTRYPHWRFGMEYERLSKSYAYGLSKIYEMVINTDPCYAYLLTTNCLTDQKLVMAHVYGHSDFFKHNLAFAHTNRRMLDVMANASVRVRRYQEAHGVNQVEEFMDKCLSLDNLIDYHNPPGRKNANAAPPPEPEAPQPQKLPAKGYMDKFINTPEYMAQQKAQIQKQRDQAKKFPERPMRDVLQFLQEHAPLEAWQQDCLAIVREEAYYFAPQGQTKIMNEGWASYWHTHLMTGHGLLTDSEVVHYADVHSGTTAVQPGGLNPYKIGLELFRDIEERWNKGQFGKDWDECIDMEAKAHWNKELGLGRKKIFEVRKLYSDVTFIDEFLTEDFCRRHKLFTFAHNQRSGQSEIETREFKKVKAKLLSQLTNFGQPVIEVEDGNYQNRGELLLVHRFDGQELRPDYADLTLRNLYGVWQRPVNLATMVNEKKKICRFDGQQYTEIDS